LVSLGIGSSPPHSHALLPGCAVGHLLEALWKQEGDKCCASLRKRRCSPAWLKSTNSLKMRRERKFCAFLRGLIQTAHNLKVVGSNPTPATNFSQI
jgi:hypothetical protein